MSDEVKLPPVPVFRPTFIRMQRSGSITDYNASLTYSYIRDAVPDEALKRQAPVSPMLGELQQKKQKRKRKRKSSFDDEAEDEDEALLRKKEIKTAHSIIEKRRRIKMNREFEALKFLVPACRIAIVNGITSTPQTPQLDSIENSNMMHKLTILQSTVEYIKYLHEVVNLQNRKIQEHDPEWASANNVSFAQFDLELDEYRNIDHEFDFNAAFSKVAANEGRPVDSPNFSKMMLPSPLITPDFQSNGGPLFKLPKATTSFKLPLPALSSPQLPSKPRMCAIDESTSPGSSPDPHLDASKVLLLMKRRTSIESLLN